MRAIYAWANGMLRHCDSARRGASDSSVLEPDRRLVMAMMAAGMIFGAVLWPQSASVPSPIPETPHVLRSPVDPPLAVNSPGQSHASLQPH